MTTIIILNVVFSVFIVAAMLVLLGWGIVSNRKMVVTLARAGRNPVRDTTTSPFERGRDRLRVRTAHPARPQRRRALDLSA